MLRSGLLCRSEVGSFTLFRADFIGMYGKSTELVATSPKISRLISENSRLILEISRLFREKVTSHFSILCKRSGSIDGPPSLKARISPSRRSLYLKLLLHIPLFKVRSPFRVLALPFGKLLASSAVRGTIRTPESILVCTSFPRDRIWQSQKLAVPLRYNYRSALVVRFEIPGMTGFDST